MKFKYANYAKYITQPDHVAEYASPISNRKKG